MLRVLSNILWVLLGGLWLALVWGICGVVLCLTVVGIPFGLQCFKIARLSLLPYGKKVELNFSEHPIANIIWLFVGGWEMALMYLLFGALSCMTVIGIPKGIQCFKIMKLAFFPFGARIK
ncbi:MAG: YccF domain-containing protein [Clostridia bacterium]|nr:YccF domain-containing protein [Clostridia bacterium]